jgi:subtilisin family serine protease
MILLVLLVSVLAIKYLHVTDLECTDWPDAPKNPDNDPMDEIGHGTHVAGIVAGKNDWYVSLNL